MNFLKKIKKGYQSAVAEETVDREFDEAHKKYFNVEAAILQLIQHIDAYSQAWDQLISLRNQISGDFLFFFALGTRNRDVGERYTDLNRNLFQNLIHKHQAELRKVVSEIQQIGTEFIQTREKCDSRVETRKIFDRKRYALGQFTSGNNFDKEQAARKHEKVKHFENEYLNKTRELRTIFGKLEERSGHLMDHTLEEFLKADHQMIKSVHQSANTIKKMRDTVIKRREEASEEQKQKFIDRGERRRMSTWTQTRVEKLKDEFNFVKTNSRKTENANLYYFRDTEATHPLHLSLKDIVDFDFMHELLSPTCKKHPRIKELTTKPCKVKTKHLSKRILQFTSFSESLLNIRRATRRVAPLSQKPLPVYESYISEHEFREPVGSNGSQFLEFNAEVRLFVLKRDPSGWLFGQNDEGQAGWFPETYVRKAYDDRVVPEYSQSQRGSSEDFLEM